MQEKLKCPQVCRLQTEQASNYLFVTLYFFPAHIFLLKWNIINPQKTHPKVSVLQEAQRTQTYETRDILEKTWRQSTWPVPMTLGQETWVCVGSGREPGLSRKTPTQVATLGDVLPPSAGTNSCLKCPPIWLYGLDKCPQETEGHIRSGTGSAFAHDNSRLALNEWADGNEDENSWGRGRDLTYDLYVLSDFGMNKLLTSLYFLGFLPHLYFYLTLHHRRRDQPFVFERRKPAWDHLACTRETSKYYMEKYGWKRKGPINGTNFCLFHNLFYSQPWH